MRGIVGKVYSIGHSNHSLEKFIGLLAKRGIEKLVDIRSRPVSFYFPHFSKISLSKSLTASGISYVFLGDKLGGRPIDTSLYTPDGVVDYYKLVESRQFVDGIDELYKLAINSTTAFMCSEENPINCHRKFVSGKLSEKGLLVLHIRGNGVIELHSTEIESMKMKRPYRRTAT